jgi:hypothetical protein
MQQNAFPSFWLRRSPSTSCQRSPVEAPRSAATIGRGARLRIDIDAKYDNAKCARQCSHFRLSSVAAL